MPESHPRPPSVSRRAFLGGAAAAASAIVTSGTSAGAAPNNPNPTPFAAPAPPARKSSGRIAAIVTEYRPLSHADVILTRVVRDYILTTRPVRSRVKLSSMYIDQFPDRDMARWIAKTYGVKIAPTIREAILDEKGKLAVDAVWLIGEHGQYPYNERGQHLYPRRHFFEGTIEAFKEAGAVAPVFNDKHLSARWKDAKFMYDTAKAMGVPFMAGSSLPLAWRRPPLELPLETKLEEALVVAYGGIESYGFHALETLQCMVERRRGGETGVRSVQCLEGAAVWEAGKSGRWSRELMDAALSRAGIDSSADADLATGLVAKRVGKPAAYLIEYNDGLRATVLMLNGLVQSFYFAARLPGQSRPVSTQFWLQEPVYGHFAYLTNAIAEMTLSGESPYPVERTLLTTGVLCRGMDSRFEKHRKIETPELEVEYRGVDHGLGAYSGYDDLDDRAGGWIELFDGKSIDNWRENVWEGKPRWIVENGVLRSTGGKGYLATLDVFDDFELFAEVRISDPTTGRGNSGIYFRCQPHLNEKQEYPPAYEVQIDHGDRNNPTGSIYNMGEAARAPRGSTKDGEWMTLRLKIEGPRIRTWVNGEPMVDWTDPEHRYKNGYVLVQQHHATGVVEVRELRIRRLSG